MRRKMIATKPLFFISLIVIVLTILLVYISGLENYRSLYLNSLYSLSILSGAFFLFITLGLYNNFKIKDSLGKIWQRKYLTALPNKNTVNPGFRNPFENFNWYYDIFEGGVLYRLGGIMMALIAFIWLLLVWIFGASLWVGIIILIAMLYWIFFRALRMVFKMASVCKDNLLKSMGYGLFYTVLYNCWLYGIIFSLHFLVK